MPVFTPKVGGHDPNGTGVGSDGVNALGMGSGTLGGCRERSGFHAYRMGGADPP